MTDDLVQRLRSNRPIPTLPHEAADRIEAQAAEIKWLRDLLNHVANEADHDCETMWITDIIRAALEQNK